MLLVNNGYNMFEARRDAGLKHYDAACRRTGVPACRRAI